MPKVSAAGITVCIFLKGAPPFVLDDPPVELFSVQPNGSDVI